MDNNLEAKTVHPTPEEWQKALIKIAELEAIIEKLKDDIKILQAKQHT